jgi:hypothetical protein
MTIGHEHAFHFLSLDFGLYVVRAQTFTVAG